MVVTSPHFLGAIAAVLILVAIVVLRRVGGGLERLGRLRLPLLWQVSYREVRPLGVSLSPPPALEGARLVLLEYADVQNWFFTLFTGDAIRRREHCLSQLRPHGARLHALALLTTAPEPEVQERALSVVRSVWPTRHAIAPWLRSRLEPLSGKLSSPGANERLRALLE